MKDVGRGNGGTLDSLLWCKGFLMPSRREDASLSEAVKEMIAMARAPDPRFPSTGSVPRCPEPLSEDVQELVRVLEELDSCNAPERTAAEVVEAMRAVEFELGLRESYSSLEESQNPLLAHFWRDDDGLVAQEELS